MVPYMYKIYRDKIRKMGYVWKKTTASQDNKWRFVKITKLTFIQITTLKIALTDALSFCSYKR